MAAADIMQPMKLDSLLQGLGDAPAIEVDDITLDSRGVTPGAVFLACRGLTAHGVAYAGEAVRRGACAIVYDATTVQEVPAQLAVPMVPVEGLAGHLGVIADRFFRAPSSGLRVAGVTGTNGKSTVAWLLSRAWATLGRPCAYNGTLGYGTGELTTGDERTSPDVVEMHRRLAGFRDEGAERAAIEVSSHALDQGRVDGVRFATTLFTNLSRDHLDYHGDMHRYGAAKARLFSDFPADHRIINVDSEFGASLAAQVGPAAVIVSTAADAVAKGRRHVFVRVTDTSADGSTLRVRSSWGDTGFDLPLAGEFNVANAALVLAALLAEGVELEEAARALEHVPPAPGRMERVKAHGGPAVYVDYAHTPGALDVALNACRAHCDGELWCVFGCGGDRDAGKRPLMGRVAEDLAGQVVITTDNPRSENPRAIIDAIVSGLQYPDRAKVIEDRAAAIDWAIASARPEDVVLIAGKGHESYQELASGRIEFSDRLAAGSSLARRGDTR
jgi:UDP-N-acetylmuramoyl-L-alanyl-D-glutamate--2,6-diaminopimelate ligase